jgi:hypothetical protein
VHTGQDIRTDAGGVWFFDAGSIALDFAHTGGFADDPDGLRPRSHLGEMLATPADLDHWLSVHTEPVDVGAGDRELHDARELRAAIARLAVAAAPAPAPAPSSDSVRRTAPRPDDIDTVNLFAALPDVPPSLPGGRRRAGANRVRLGQAMSSIARDAVALFTEVGFDAPGTDGAPVAPVPPSAVTHDVAGTPTDHGSRLGRCAAPDCGLVFFDASRGGTRRWCAMQRCGNREKVRAHRARAGGPPAR